MIVVSTGCPCGVGPEVAIRAATRLRGVPRVLVGDERTLLEAADLCGVSRSRFLRFDGASPDPRKILIRHVGPSLSPRDRRAGKPTKRSGAVQLAYVAEAYRLTKQERGRALVTAPVSKAAIVRSGIDGFIGHTEWLAQRDRAKRAIMCFWSKRLATSLVTTHLALADVPRALSPRRVEHACTGLAELLRSTGVRRPTVAVASLNPHAGEGELFGQEESRAIAPGLRRAQKVLGRRARLVGPIGAETAYRRALSRDFDGVVAMYHDQATIPMKLVAFGEAVNVTVGLSVVRTSVDHGTAYDIAWSGRADPSGMVCAMKLAARLSK